MKLQVQKKGALPGHKDSIYALCSAEEGSFFSAGGDGFIVKWNANDLSAPGLAVAQLPWAVYSLAFLPRVNRLFAGCRNGILYVFDLAEKREAGQFQLEAEVFAIIHDHDILMAGTAGGKLYSFDITEMQMIAEKQFSAKSCRALSQRNGLIASGWSDNFIRFISRENLGLVHEFEAHANSVFSLAFSPDGRYLLSGSRDAHLRIWDMNDHSLFMDIPAHWFAINTIQYSTDGQLFATGSRDKTIKIWDVFSFELLKVIDKEKLEGHTHSINALLWLSETMLLSAGDDRQINMWQVDPV